MLNDLRELDLSTDFGLMCGQLLADMGAEVQQWVRPEHAARLRDSRHWQAYTLGKGVRVVDWPNEPGLLHAQLGHADVLIESETPGVLAGLGLDRAALEALNPRLIHVTITGFGADGPKAGFAYTDLTVTAASGHLYVTGSADGPPLRIGSPQAHAHAAADAAVGVLIALNERERTGRGQQVDAAGQDSVTLALLSRGLDGAVGQSKAQRSAYGAQMGGVRMRNQFQARDGWVVVLQGVLPPLADFMKRLMAWVHEEGLCAAADLEWNWGQAGMMMMQGKITAAQWAPVQDGIEALVARHTKLELMNHAVARRLLIAPVLTPGELLDSPHVAAREFIRQGRAGRRLGPFAHFERSPLPLRESEPRLWGEAGPVPGQAVSPRVASGPIGSAAPRLGFEPAPGAGPLAGLKVLDLFWVVAGPGATRMLADYGATVVHVESSRRLDMVRNVPPYIEGVPDPERAACHHTTNCNKLNVTLDLGKPEGRAVLADLARWADVFTESFAPGVVERMGFGYEAVRRINPEIIMISSSLMGQSGPWSPYAGYGNLAAAVSGFHALTGYPDAPPTGCFGPYTDFTSVRFNALAILGALRHRAATGEGQYIDMGQAEAALQFLAPECLAYLRDGITVDAPGNRDAHRVPSGVFPTAGVDRWIAITVETDAQWQALCALAGLEALWSSGVRDLSTRRVREAEIEDRLAAWTREHDGLELEMRLQARGVPAHRVLDTHDLAQDPQLAHRGHFVPVTHRAFAPAAVESARLRLSRSQPRAAEFAPWFGIDNERVLREVLNYDPARIQALIDGGVMQ
jgi:crotonobetainyl-CoA:carnitine CoA-transferase CaiB-like acyl-CoA transferase